MTIKELVDKSYQTSKSKGFHDNYNIILKMVETKEFSLENIEYVKQLLVSQKLMLIVSELGESLEATRINRFTDTTEDILSLEGEEFIKTFKEKVKDTFEDEIADVFIRLGDMCGSLNVDIEKHILLKQKFNETRSKMHGKNF